MCWRLPNKHEPYPGESMLFLDTEQRGSCLPWLQQEGCKEASTEAISSGRSQKAVPSSSVFLILKESKQANRDADEGLPPFESGKSGCLLDRFVGIQFVFGKKSKW